MIGKMKYILWYTQVGGATQSTSPTSVFCRQVTKQLVRRDFNIVGSEKLWRP